MRFIFQHRELLWLLIRRDLAVRTSGTVIGGLWMILQPALQVAALWFLLDLVLKVKFPGLPGGFVGYYLTGMIPWLFLAEVTQRSLGVLPEYGALYQRSLFPLPLLPLIPVAVSGGIYSSIYICVAQLLFGWHGAIGALVLMGSVVIWVVPFAYGFAVLGLFIRDLQQLAPFVLTMLMYATPILYLPDAFPKSLHWWLVINPFAHMVRAAHALVQGQPWHSVDAVGLLLLWLLALPAIKLYRRAEPHMREAL